MVLAGFMKLVGPDFLAPLRAAGPSTPTPRCRRRSPACTGPAEALAYGVKVTGCTLFVVDDGVDTGPIVAQRPVPVGRRRHRRVAARADQGGRAGDARRRRRPDGPRGLHHHRQEGAVRHMSRPRHEQRPRADQARPGLRLRQDRARGPGPRARRGRRRARVHRRLGGADRVAGRAGDPRRGADRLPRVPRRPGQDPAPRRARGHPRRPAARDPPRTSSPSSGSSRSTWW